MSNTIKRTFAALALSAAALGAGAGVASAFPIGGFGGPGGAGGSFNAGVGGIQLFSNGDNQGSPQVGNGGPGGNGKQCVVVGLC
ncbi:hypothetical protein [Rhodococcus daqingensis]|uniref:DUF320 domain-containing protein n=1 Tax=Rhodococcus daqingensis TaxID=2479363 RepID=A0ABW2S5J4_9NOCA